MRYRLCAAAVKLTEAVHYQGAGTIEFLYDDATQAFYFIEMNTRIQVEHPVSECVTGIDLIRVMIRIANGEKLTFKQEDIQCRGHAIEVRINAEDPTDNFMPSPGVIDTVNLPHGPGVRFDGCIYPGYAVSPFYDSLLGKLIVWDENRQAAIARLKRALHECAIDGVHTTQPLFQALVDERDVCNGSIHSQWLERWLQDNANSLTGTPKNLLRD